MDVEGCFQPQGHSKLVINSHPCYPTGLTCKSNLNIAVMAPYKLKGAVHKQKNHLATSVPVGHFTLRKQMSNSGSRRNCHLYPLGVV